MRIVSYHSLITLVLLLRTAATTCVTELLYPTNYAYNGDFQLPNIGLANYQVATPGNLTGWYSTKS